MIEAGGKQRAMARLFKPETIAIVGARDGSRLAENCRRTLESDAEVYIVNPTQDVVFGHHTVASLKDIGSPVDAVLCLVSAERAVEVAEEAASCDVGGLVIIAAGFAEIGSDGAAYQARLKEAAQKGGFVVVGPNGAGFVSVPKRLDMTFLAQFARRPGGASLVSQSGGLLEAVAAAADRAGGIGLNLLISAGNEAVTDVADYVDYLVDDPDTSVVLLALEVIRRPDAFFAAVRRARQADKPVIALKIGRSDRVARMTMSHTGTLTSDPWVYDVAFRQANILPAIDVGDLVDRAQMFEQLPRTRWVPVDGLAVMAGSGGMASLGADIALEAGLPVPEVPELDRWIGTVIPGAEIANPFDSRGLAADMVFRTVYEKFAESPSFDSAVFFGQFADWDEEAATLRADQLAESTISRKKALVISPFAGIPGRWLDRYRDRGIVVGNGPRGVMRGLAAMSEYMRSDPESLVVPPSTTNSIPWDGSGVVTSDRGLMLNFDTTMRLLEQSGVPVSPYWVVEAPGQVGSVPFPPPYVVKLADVPHRSEIGAIRMGVDSRGLAQSVSELQEIALGAHTPTAVVVQPMFTGAGEIFLGGHGRSEIGPVTVFGLGGTMVEVLNRIGGRMAPFDHRTAGSLIDEFATSPLRHWLKPGDPVVRADLEQILVNVSLLIARTRTWLMSLDINPILVTKEGFVAVDGLAVVKLTEPKAEAHRSSEIVGQVGKLHHEPE
jgi:acyl-CoA synthetase (NDP forming)